MYRFFSSVMAPLLDAAKPSVVVEVGSDNGYGTELLATWCHDHGSRLHVVDPLPKYDTEEWQGRWPGTVAFHLDLSLNALGAIEAPDVVCIDGDHNWYTVFHEMEILGRSAAAAGQPYPLTLFHDVGWPYGRRDLYYDPSTIPEGHRHPFRKGGLVPGRPSVAEQGFNDHLDNAIHEGTPRNGVLTAVEDFVARYDGELRLHTLPGLHGLGVVVDAGADAAVLEAVAEVTGPDGLRRVVEAVEADRISRLEELSRLQRQASQHQQRALRAAHEVALQAETVTRLETELERAQSNLAGLAARADTLERRLDESKRRRRRLSRRLQRAQSRLERREHQLAGVRRRLTTTEADLASARGAAAVAERDFARLRNRRSVRAALWLAGLSRPVFRLRRRG